MKRLALTIFAVALLGAAAFAQGRLSKDGDPGNPDRPQPRATASLGQSVNSAVPSKPMRLIISGATIEDFEVKFDDIDVNVDKKYRVYSTLTLNLPADPSRSFMFVCSAAGIGFWQQVPSDSPLMISPVLLVRFDTPLVDGGAIYQAFDMPDRRREFEPSTQKVNHTPIPSGCGMIDEPQMVLFLVNNYGMSQADALALGRAIIRSAMKMTIGFNVRMTSVSSFGLSDPVLQVWSD